MKDQTIHVLMSEFHNCGVDIETHHNERELRLRLRAIMFDAYTETSNSPSPYKKAARKNWRARISKCFSSDERRALSASWRAWKHYLSEDDINALKHPDEWHAIHDFDIPAPPEVASALQAADSSLTNYHRHLWHSDRKTHGGLEREAVVKTIKAIRKLTRTNVEGQEL